MSETRCGECGLPASAPHHHYMMPSPFIQYHPFSPASPPPRDETPTPPKPDCECGHGWHAHDGFGSKSPCSIYVRRERPGASHAMLCPCIEYRAAPLAPETIRCVSCGRECEPVNDSDAPVTKCVDCAAAPLLPEAVGETDAETLIRAWFAEVAGTDSTGDPVVQLPDIRDVIDELREHFTDEAAAFAEARERADRAEAARHAGCFCRYCNPPRPGETAPSASYDAQLGAALREALATLTRPADFLEIEQLMGRYDVWRMTDNGATTTENDATRALSALLHSSAPQTRETNR